MRPLKTMRCHLPLFFIFGLLLTGINVFGQATVKQETPIAFLESYTGLYSYTQTGGTLRKGPDYAADQCNFNASSTSALSGITGGSTITKAYLYWAGSGSVDNTVTLQGQTVTASKSYTSIITYNQDESHFGCVADVTNIVAANGNTNYTFSGLTVNSADPYCRDLVVLGGWALIVIYNDPSLPFPHKINLYEGWDVTQGSSTVPAGFTFTMTGINVPTSGIKAKITGLFWEGDAGFSGTAAAPEQLKFNGTVLTDANNPSTNAFNSTINTLSPYTNFYGIDLDSYDVSAYVAAGATSATVQMTTGQDLVFSNLLVMDIPTYTIDAVDDSYTISAGNTSTGNVLENDLVNTKSVNNNVNLTQVSTTDTRVTLNPDGTVKVAAGTPGGTYKITYDICYTGATTYCDQAVVTITVPNVMPVTFGNITATTKNEMLYVNWSTLSETNFKFFDVEASTNGKNFVKIGSVDSKSINGNSAQELQYSFSKNISETKNLLGLHVNILAAIAFLLFLSSVVWAATHTRRKKSNIAIVVLLGIVLSSAMFACSKNDDPAAKVNSKLYVRIITYDINGDSSSSKVIEAVQE